MSALVVGESIACGTDGFCPSCDLTVEAPDPTKQFAPALVSSAREIPALPARRLPVARTGASNEAALARAASKDKTGRAPGLIRQAGIPEEAEWGIRDDHSLVPMRVVTRFQSFLPWLGIALLIGTAWIVSHSFVAEREQAQAVEIPSAQEPKKRSKIPLGSELWVVLDALSTAVTPEEVLSLVRHPSEVRPKLLAYYAENEIELPHRFERARPGVKIFALGGKRFARFEGRCDGRPVKFSFEGTEFGWRLDWESLVGYSEQRWEDFLDDRPEGEHQFRVLASVSGDELLEYDRERYICLQLTDNLQTGTGFALVDRYGEVAHLLGKFLEISAQARDGTIPQTWITPVLGGFEDSEELLEIVDLKSASWLIP